MSKGSNFLIRLWLKFLKPVGICKVISPYLSFLATKASFMFNRIRVIIKSEAVPLITAYLDKSTLANTVQSRVPKGKRL